MNDSRYKTESTLRRQHNSELIRRMRNGDSLNAIDSRASWFPPRPILQKDAREMSRVYNQTVTRMAGASPKAPEDNGKVVSIVPNAPAPVDEAG